MTDYTKEVIEKRGMKVGEVTFNPLEGVYKENVDGFVDGLSRYALGLPFQTTREERKEMREYRTANRTEAPGANSHKKNAKSNGNGGEKAQAREKASVPSMPYGEMSVHPALLEAGIRSGASAILAVRTTFHALEHGQQPETAKEMTYTMLGIKPVIMYIPRPETEPEKAE